MLRRESTGRKSQTVGPSWHFITSGSSDAKIQADTPGDTFLRRANGRLGLQARRPARRSAAALNVAPQTRARLLRTRYRLSLRVAGTDYRCALRPQLAPPSFAR